MRAIDASALQPQASWLLDPNTAHQHHCRLMPLQRKQKAELALAMLVH
jgi:hypothetical protein